MIQFVWPELFIIVYTISVQPQYTSIFMYDDSCTFSESKRNLVPRSPSVKQSEIWVRDKLKRGLSLADVIA